MTALLMLTLRTLRLLGLFLLVIINLMGRLQCILNLNALLFKDLGYVIITDVCQAC